MPTQVASGSTAANKMFNAALFVEATKRNSFCNMNTGPAPKSVDKKKIDSKKQTAQDYPIVRVTDLEKEAGDEVTVDLFHQFRHKPTMGDRKLAGRGASMTSSQHTLKIQQGRTMVDSGGKMTQQRTKHNLKNTARRLLGPYYNILEDQICLVHAAGARGSHIDADWIVPTDDDPEFAEIMVNSVTPPTFDRHFYAGDATGLGDMDSADTFGLDEVDMLRLVLDEMPFPLQPIKFEGDPMAEDSPFHALFVSPRMWNSFWTGTDGAMWRTLVANAHQRAANFKHPIFTGEVAIWNNILIRKQPRPIRFASGETVTICTNSADAATTTVSANTSVERGILMGAQAIANAFGMSGKKSDGGFYFSMHEEETDHGNVVEHSIRWMNGKSKIRFEGTDGRINDHGIAVIDAAVVL